MTTVRFDLGFEGTVDGLSDSTSGWHGTATSVPGGTGGIPAADGSSYAILDQTATPGSYPPGDPDGATGPFTRFDGYRALSSDQGVTTSVDIYLDPTAWASGEGFSYSVAANGQNGSHIQDYVFHVSQDTSTGNMLIGSSTGSTFEPREDLDTLSNFSQVSTAGWYSFTHTFQDDGFGNLEVVLSVVEKSSGTPLYTETIAASDGGSPVDFASDFGGNRYGWFTNIDVAGGIAVDNLTLESVDMDPIQVFDGTNIIGSFADEASAIAGIEAGDLADEIAALSFSTGSLKVTGGATDFFYVADSQGMSIQDAVDAASAGDTVRVGDGTYVENVLIDKSLTLLSENGRAATVIEGVSGIGALGAVQLSPGVDDVQIGDTGRGFQIVGIDNDVGGAENAAIYLQGPHDGFTLRDNEVEANGEHGLASEFSATVTNLVIDGNEFSGQTFQGAQPGGIGFSTQFDPGNNVPRQLVVLGNGGGAPQSSTNVTFTNNLISGTTGGISSDDNVSEQGNTMVTIDVNGATIDGNTFTGTTARFATGLRARGPNTDITNNTFDNTGGGDTRGVFIQNQTGSEDYSGNVFLGGGDGDIFAATPGNDDISGGAGDDVLIGGDGDDLFNPGAAVAGDSIFGGNGTDTADYTDEAGSVTFDLPAGTVTRSGGAVDVIDSVENIIGGDGGITIIGTAADETFTTGAGDDSISAAGGNDVIEAGLGNDEVDGGAGTDIARIDDNNFAGFDLSDYTFQSVSVSGGSFSGTIVGPSGTDVYSGIEILQVTNTGSSTFIVAPGMSIQAAINAASAGDTIVLQAGIHVETNITVDKELTISGQGGGAVTVLGAAGGNGFVITNAGAAAVVTFEDIRIVNATGSGILVNSGSTVDRVVLDGMEINGSGSNALQVRDNGANDVHVLNSSFVNNGLGASGGDGALMFFQYNGDATIQNVDITANGSGDPFPPSGPPTATGSQTGIQFRGDTGSLGNVTLDTITIDGTHSRQPIGIFNYDDIDGLTLDNVTINADSTGFDVALNIDGVGGTVDLANETGPGAKFVNLSVPNLSVNGDVIAVQGDATNNVLGGSVNADFIRGYGGDDQLRGNAGDDVILGFDRTGSPDSDTDTASFSGSFGDYTITFTSLDLGFGAVPGIDISGPDGDDFVGQVEKLSFDGDAGQVLLVGGGGYATIQAAVDAATAGDTILVAAGSYAENVVIDKALTLLGAQAGNAATGAARAGGESVINGGGTFAITVNADNVTIDGFEIADFARDGINVRTDEVAKPGDASIGAYRTGIDIQNNWIHDAPGATGQRNGVLLGEFMGGPTISTEDAQIEDFAMSGNFIDLESTGGRAFALTNQFQFITLLDSVIDQNTFDAVTSFFGSAVPDTFLLDQASMTGNTFEGLVNSYNFLNSTIDGNTFNYVALLGVDGSAISNNVFNATDFYGLGLWGDEFGSNISQNSTISGNTFNYNTVATAESYIAGVRVRPGVDADSLDFDSNTFNNGGFNVGLTAADVRYDGGAGNDVLTADDIQDLLGNPVNVSLLINGGDGEDSISGGQQADYLNGGADDDNIAALAGDDTVDGGDGADNVQIRDNAAHNPFDINDFDFSGFDATDGIVNDTIGVDGRTVTLSNVETVEVLNTGSSTFIVSSGMSIQDAIDQAAAGDTIFIRAGTYAENIVVDKALTITGETDVGGAPAATIGTGSGDAILVTAAAGGAVTVANVETASGASNGIDVATGAVLTSLTLDNVSISGATGAGFNLNDADGVALVEILNSAFAQNAIGQANVGDIVFFQYHGDITITDTTITGAPAFSVNTARAANAIQIAGFEQSDYDVTQPIGTVAIDGLVIDGSYRKPMFVIQGFTDLANLSFANTSLSGDTGWGDLLFIDPIGSSGQALEDTPGNPGFFKLLNGGNDIALDLSGVTVTNNGTGATEAPFGVTTPAVDVRHRGTDADDVVTGTNARDLLGNVAEGNNDFGGDDEYYGGDGDDVLVGGAGNDTLDGGNDTDTAIFQGSLADYTLSVTTDPSTGMVTAFTGITDNETITFDDGTDTLNSVERLVFAGDGATLELGTDVQLFDNSANLIGTFATIQDAVDAATDGAGQTILVAAGTFGESVNVNKSGLTIQGAGVGTTTLMGTLLADLGVPPGMPLNDFFEANHPAYSASNGFSLNADNVTITGFSVSGFSVGVSLGNTDGSTIDGNQFIDNVNGIRKGSTQVVTNIDISNNQFTQGIYGFTNYAATSGAGAFDGVTMDANSFSALSEKGLYFEQLSNASLTGNMFDDVGNYGRISPPFGGTDGEFGNAIDINLKYETYENVTFTDTVITDSGRSDQDGTGPTGLFGAAIGVKIRDDGPSYDTVPADFTGQIQFIGGSIDGTSTAFRVGEPGKDNLGPDVLIDDVLISNTTVTDIDNATDPVDGGTTTVVMDPAQVSLDASVSQATVDITGNALANTIDGGTADDSLEGAGADDDLDGGAGTDTAVYAGNRVDFTLAETRDVNGFVTAFGGATDDNAGDGDEGTDAFTSIEAVRFEGDGTTLDLTKAVQVFDGTDMLIGTYDTLKDAVDAATGGETIRVKAGAFDSGDGSQIVIDVDLTIEGAGKAATTILADHDTATAGDARGWFLVEDGVTLNVSDIGFDGNGYDIWQAFRHKGGGTFDNVAFTDIEYQETGSPYAGTAIAAFTVGGTGENVDVTNSMFSDIGRIGVQYFGAGTTGLFQGNVYTGKGTGDFLDYAVEIGAGAVASIVGNTITDNAGVASSDGSVSAGVLVTTFFAPGSQATISGNVLTNNTLGIAVGFDAVDTSSVTIGTGNVVTGGTTGLSVTGNATVTGVPNLGGTGGTVDWNGGAADNSIEGAALADDLSGGLGNDSILGNAGGDTIDGGDGNDTIDGQDGADQIQGGGGSDSIMGGLGNDVIYGGDDADWINAGGGLDTIFGGAGGDSISGSGGADLISGDDGDDLLFGGSGGDSISAGLGNDEVTGGTGDDSLDGGAGIDTLDYSARSENIAGILNSSILVALSGGGFELDSTANFENLRTGSGDDNVEGTSAANTIWTGDGEDTVFGGAGDDRIFGGLGNDSLQGDAGNDSFIGGAGADAMDGGAGSQDWADYSASGAGIVLYLDGTAGSGGDAAGDTLVSIENVLGSNFDDLIFGNGSANRLVGGLGNDTLDGGGGSDTLIGGDGADSFIGGAGTDTVDYSDATGAVTIDLAGAGGSGAEAQGDTYTGVESFIGSGFGDTMIGDGAANEFYGGAGNDDLSGGLGDDKLEGGDGDDTLFGGAGADVLRGDGGIDTLDYSDATGAVTVNMISRVNKGAEAEGDIIKDIENVIGSDFGDIVSADNLANTIWGGGGKDFLRGRDGDDALYGGDENDILRGEAGADTLDGGDGTDLIMYNTSQSAVTVDLALGTGSGGHAAGDVIIDVENVRGSSFGDTLIGNGIKNRLEGSGGGDTIFGGGGDDIIAGQGGFDFLTGGADADRFLYNETNWGEDHITDFEDGIDRIDMRGSGLTFGDLTITFNGGDAKIQYANPGEVNNIILDGIDINVTTIDANDFIF